MALGIRFALELCILASLAALAARRACAYSSATNATKARKGRFAIANPTRRIADSKRAAASALDPSFPSRERYEPPLDALFNNSRQGRPAVFRKLEGIHKLAPEREAR
jgi:hypothetical protein